MGGELEIGRGGGGASEVSLQRKVVGQNKFDPCLSVCVYGGGGAELSEVVSTRELQI